MKFNRSDVTRPEPAAADAGTESMQDFAQRERASTLEQVKKDRARNEQQLRGLAGDEEVDRMKRYGQLS